MNTMTKLQEVSFEIIANAGEAKALAYESLAAAKEKNVTLYQEKMNEAELSINIAHKLQFELLRAEANEELENAMFSILVVHAQDHLMTVMLTIELIRELAELHIKGLQ